MIGNPLALTAGWLACLTCGFTYALACTLGPPAGAALFGAPLPAAGAVGIGTATGGGVPVAFPGMSCVTSYPEAPNPEPDSDLLALQSTVALIPDIDAASLDISSVGPSYESAAGLGFPPGAAGVPPAPGLGDLGKLGWPGSGTNAAGRTRTADLSFRKRLLYPTELQPHEGRVG